jgi:hypothetical protein
MPIPASQREVWKERKVVMLGVLADDGRVIFYINKIQHLFFGVGGMAYPLYVRGTEAIRACPC